MRVSIYSCNIQQGSHNNIIIIIIEFLCCSRFVCRRYLRFRNSEVNNTQDNDNGKHAIEVAILFLYKERKNCQSNCDHVYVCIFLYPSGVSFSKRFFLLQRN